MTKHAVYFLTFSGQDWRPLEAKQCDMNKSALVKPLLTADSHSQNFCAGISMHTDPQHAMGEKSFYFIVMAGGVCCELLLKFSTIVHFGHI